MNNTGTEKRSIQEILKMYDREFSERATHYTLATRACRNYVVFAEKCEGVKRKFSTYTEGRLFGTSLEKMTTVSVYDNRPTDLSPTVAWHFEEIVSRHGKKGYCVRSWRDCIDVQVSKETAEIMLQLILLKAESMEGCTVLVEDGCGSYNK